MKYIDLHVHSNFSDGTCTPSEIVFLAADLGLSAIALTDHDTVSGVAEAVSAAYAVNTAYAGITTEAGSAAYAVSTSEAGSAAYAVSTAEAGSAAYTVSTAEAGSTSAGNESERREPEEQIAVIPGAEITAGYQGRDIHILGLYIDYKNQELIEGLAQAVRSRDLRNEKMAENLRRAGIPVTIEALREMEPETVITRAHFARFLTTRGYTRSNQEAFDRYLGSDTPYYVKRDYMEPETAIRLIHRAGGLAVLAHPLIYRYSLENTEALIAKLKHLGLDGLEVFYSSNTGFDEGYLRRFANRYGLLMTGGSDFHGSNKPNLEIGTGRGNLKVPESLLAPMRDELSGKRAAD